LAQGGSRQLRERAAYRVVYQKDKGLQPCLITDAVVLMYTWISADFELLRQTSAAQLGFSLNQIRGAALGIPPAPSFH
jgi:hypothetical protein